MKILINTGPSEAGWHPIETFAKCPRLYAHKYLLGTKLPVQEPLVRGSLVHVGLAHVYARIRAGQQGVDPEQYYTPDAAIELAADDWGDMGRSLVGAIQHTVRAYQQTYLTERFEIVAIEEEVRSHLRSKHLFTQRWDLVLRDSAKKIWVWDHKTAAKPSASTAVGYTMSGQFLMAQALGAKKYGRDFGGTRINLVSVGETPKFARVSPSAAPAAGQRVVDDLVRWLDLMAEYKRTLKPEEFPGAWNEHACRTLYGPCPAYSVCQWGS